MENIKFEPKNIKLVKIDQICPNAWNPKDKDTDEFRMIVRGIEKKGLQAPIFCRTVPDIEGYEIVDGEQRWRACKQLGYASVLVYNMGALTDQEAKEMTLWFEHKVPFNEITLAHMLKDMASLPDLIVPFTDEQLANYKEMSEFNWQNYQDGELELQDTDSEKSQHFNVTPEQLARIQMIVDEGVGDATVALMTVDKIKVTSEQKATIFDALHQYKKKYTDTSDGEALSQFAVKAIAGLQKEEHE